jgi:hypothetical protein|tara:strand:+ start:245 stop:535 length:291 start_codon:yes stop_codon:yes gene_type:complete
MNNNKLIAEFMGDYAYNIEGAIPYGDFTNSWDWLMPVVEKIESLGYEFFIVEDRIKIAHNTDHSTETIIDFTLGGSKRDATYKAVVEFVKWHNKKA